MTAESRIGPPFGGLNSHQSRHPGSGGDLVFDGPHFIRHVARCPQVLSPSSACESWQTPPAAGRMAIPCRLKPWGLQIPYRGL
jgi:hypothetical protein